MAKKYEDDRREIECTYVVYTVVLAEAVVKLTEAWDTFRDFDEDESRELTEREVIHLKSALYMVKEIFEVLSSLSVKYNYKNAKKKGVVPFRTGAIDVHDKGAKEL